MQAVEDISTQRRSLESAFLAQLTVRIVLPFGFALATELRSFSLSDCQSEVLCDRLQPSEVLNSLLDFCPHFGSFFLQFKIRKPISPTLKSVRHFARSLADI